MSGFTWTIETSDEHASEGTRSVRITNEGDFDDGTTVARETEATHFVDAVSVELSPLGDA